jgi:hypothetical protein
VTPFGVASKLTTLVWHSPKIQKKQEDKEKFIQVELGFSVNLAVFP